MSLELLLLRHAKSDWHSEANTDFDRPLNPRGYAAAQRMGHWLKTTDLIPDFIVSSPALRTTQTLQRLLPELGLSQDLVRWDKRIYEANIAALIDVLADCPASSRRVLLVGHNPGLEQLLVYLSREQPVTEDGKIMPTAALARLALPADGQWTTLESTGCRLLGITRPRQLD